MNAAVTGTPGTGKTEVSKKLAQITGMEYVSVNDLARKEDCILSEDVERHTDVVEVDRLRTHTADLDECVLDGHLSHFLEPDKTFVLRCKPFELRNRLRNKGWGESKIEENVDAEILGVIETEARESCDEIYSVDTTGKDPGETAGILKKILGGDEDTAENYLQRVDWIEEGEI